jgi:hypothetical protein
LTFIRSAPEVVVDNNLDNTTTYMSVVQWLSRAIAKSRYPLEAAGMLVSVAIADSYRYPDFLI